MNEREHPSPQTPPWDGCTSWRRGLHNGVLKAHPAVKINSYPSIFSGRSGKRNFAENKERERNKMVVIFLARVITDAAAWKKEGTNMAQDEKTKGRKKRSTKMLVVFSCFWRIGTLKYLDIYPKKRRKIWKNSRCCGNKRLMGGTKNNSWHEKKVQKRFSQNEKFNFVSLAAAMREGITNERGQR